jgi:hypothetical protein
LPRECFDSTTLCLKKALQLPGQNIAWTTLCLNNSLSLNNDLPRQRFASRISTSKSKLFLYIFSGDAYYDDEEYIHLNKKEFTRGALLFGAGLLKGVIVTGLINSANSGITIG